MAVWGRSSCCSELVCQRDAGDAGFRIPVPQAITVASGALCVFDYVDMVCRRQLMGSQHHSKSRLEAGKSILLANKYEMWS